jgi:HPt (histidine-containing phosphotransfer) domain-containing protein
MAKDSDLEQAIAALRREFAAALPARLGVLRVAFDALSASPERDALQSFHIVAHSLHGTAGAYEATELVQPASRLATFARAWATAGIAPTAEREQARRELESLASAIEQYRRRIESGV